ncbi:polysaccharide pyruvyl transferase family protein [Croceibacterium ferulae]|uniref:polysaccharide pyruvyl transferase family protein n=1 Tax=Croceibacterium ferulae TaxID=1854641 RepID=UPI000EB03312|nr:polysaccharide pyruvyl transferase family protein [Croceibacterium ferulae]
MGRWLDETIGVRPRQSNPPVAERGGDGVIGVLTFHRCINYGSYWQARSLVEGLRAGGHNAVLLDHQSEEVRRREWRCAFQPLLPQRSARSDLPAYGRKARKLLEAVDRLPLSAPFELEQPHTMPRVDTVVIGSDEVWNLHHPWYGGSRPFYGEGLPAGRVMSYAASFGNYDAGNGLGAEWAGRLRALDAISVRDRNAQELVRGAIGLEAPLVLDPVLQFPFARMGRSAEPFILVYGHNFPDWYAQAVRAHADARGLRLVSIGYRNDWAHEQWLDASPQEFAEAMTATAALATNFFHGCVFALLNARPFACVASSYRANKLRDLMEVAGTEHRRVEEHASGQVGTLLDTPLAPEVSERLANMRAQSSAFLATVLG